MSTASVLMKPTSVPADGFYVVRIDDREYSACVVNTAVLFRFYGVEGIIMPIDRSKEGK